MRQSAFVLLVGSVVLASLTAAWPARSNAERLGQEADAVELRLTFKGLVSFSPVGKGAEGYEPKKPMSAGKVQQVFALTPRADEFSIDGKQASRLMDLGFAGTAHPLHMSAIRLPGKHLNPPSIGDFLLPLPSHRTAKGEQSTYSVELEATDVKETKYVTLEAMEMVAVVRKGDPDTPGYAKPVEPKIAEGVPFGVLVELKEGRLVADHYYRDSTAKWIDAYERCSLQSHGVACALGKGTSADSEHDHLADSVTSIRSVVSDMPIELVVTEYRKGVKYLTLYRIPLKPDNKAVALSIESGPASELVQGWTEGAHEAFPHFKLFYLLAAKIPDTFYFPAKDEYLNRTDPFCTPLAQFVQEPKSEAISSSSR